jgi:hypothetical protein
MPAMLVFAFVRNEKLCLAAPEAAAGIIQTACVPRLPCKIAGHAFVLGRDQPEMPFFGELFEIQIGKIPTLAEFPHDPEDVAVAGNRAGLKISTCAISKLS